MKKLLFLLLLVPVLGFCQNTLHVTVEGVKTSNGKISVAVYNQQDGFLEFNKVFKNNSTGANKGHTEITIEDLPEGEYALAIFHDKNANEILDVNWLGIPQEPVGFSNAKMKTFGPPSYEECAFRVSSDREIKVAL